MRRRGRRNANRALALCLQPALAVFISGRLAGWVVVQLPSCHQLTRANSGASACHGKCTVSEWLEVVATLGVRTRCSTYLGDLYVALRGFGAETFEAHSGVVETGGHGIE